MLILRVCHKAQQSSLYGIGMLHSFNIHQSLALVSRIESDINFNANINQPSFNRELESIAFQSKDEYANLCAIGPNPFETCFDLQRGRLFIIKYTFQDKGQICLNQDLSCFVKPNGEILFYNTNLLDNIVKLARSNGFLQQAIHGQPFNILEASVTPISGYSLETFLNCPKIPEIDFGYSAFSEDSEELSTDEIPVRVKDCCPWFFFK